MTAQIIDADGSPKQVIVPYSDLGKYKVSTFMTADSQQVDMAMNARKWVHDLAATPKSTDPDKMGVFQLISELKQRDAFGPIASRWNDFLVGKVGAADTQTGKLYEALRTKMGLSNTLLMKVHVGNRGGAYMMEHFENLANAGKMDADALYTGFASEYQYVKNAAMEP